MRIHGLTVIAALLALATCAFALDMPATDGGPAVPAGAVQVSYEPWIEVPQYYPFTVEIDQNQPDGSVYMAAFSQTCLAQSFQQTHDNIAGAGIKLQSGIGSSDNVTIQLWTGLPNAGGTMLTSASATGTQGQWVDVYWTPVTVTPGTTYFLVFTGNTTLGISGSLSNPYPYGCVYANSGYMQFPSYDYAFRTYYETDVAIERSTWANVKTLFE